MNGNKPLEGSPGEFASWSPFTLRMAAHPKVAYYPYPGEMLLVTMVVDQILVGEAAAGKRRSPGRSCRARSSRYGDKGIRRERPAERERRHLEARQRTG